MKYGKWSIGLICCDIAGILLLFAGWVQINILGMAKAISPMQMVSYLRDINNYVGAYLSAYSNKVNLITACGVCLIVAYAVSIILAVMKKDSAFLIGMIAHLVMVFFSGEVASAVKKLAEYTYQVVTVTGVVYIAFIFSIVAAGLCIYIYAFHPELIESN